MFRKNTLLVNKKKNIQYMICNVSTCGEFVAIVDMNIVEKKDNSPKPKALRVDKLKTLIKKHSLKDRRYSLPAEMTFSEGWLEKNQPTWKTKRDKKFKEITSLTDRKSIEKYLYGEGLANEILSLIPSSRWNSKGAFYHALNRYISFGSIKNAFLTVGLKETGKYYQLPDKPSPENVKRGRKWADKKKEKRCNSNSRAATKHDIQNIKQVAAAFKNDDGDITFRAACLAFDRKFQRTEVIRKIGDREISVFIPFPEEDTISEDQFIYHFKRIISRADLSLIKYGRISFNKDFKDRQGDAHDGVLYATDVYEVDATLLDCYVRYPYDTSKQLTSGRPWLYIVIDVYSTMVVGMYLGFDGPNVNGAQQALANACLDKVEFAHRYGLPISEDCFPAKHPPRRVSIDNGKEYPDGFISGILNSNLGIEMFDLLPAYRGDFKGTNEGFFNVINKKVIHFLKGAVHKHMRREQQHPSNYPLYDYDALVALIMNEIIFLNTSSERMEKLNFQMVRDNIGLTPQAIFLASLQYDLDGGKPTIDSDEADVRWTFLPEEEATIRADGIYFKGLKYQSEYAKQNGWHTTARFHGAKKIPVKRIRDWTNEIWHKTPDGGFVELKLSNTNNESPFLDQHWDAVEQLKAALSARRHSLKQESRFNRALADARFKFILDENLEEENHSPQNTTKSPQKGIQERMERNKRIVAADEALQLSELFIQQNKQVIDDQFYIEGADDDIY